MAGINKKTWKTKKGINFCYEITYYDSEGKQRHRGGFKTKAEAQESLAKVTNDYTKNITLKELCNCYINEHCQLVCKPTTIKLYEGYVNNNIKTLYNKKAKSITKRDIDLLVLEWKRQDLKNKSINNLIGFLRSAYSYGISNKWINENPAKESKKLPKQSRDVRFLDEEEMSEFIKVIRTFPPNKFLPLFTAIYTGMRISELLALEWSDIDFNRLTINVNKQYYKGNLASPKTYKSTRKVNIPPELAEELRRYKEETKVLSKIIFCGTSGGYISQGKLVKNWFKKAMKRIGKPDYNFHCLRHTYATFLIQNGVPIHYVSEQLGHSTPQTTVNVYGHVLPRINNQAMNLFKNLEKSQNNRIKFSDRVKA